MKKIPSIERLSLAEKIDEEDLEMLNSTFPRLNTLDISSCEVSVGFVELARFEGLRELGLPSSLRESSEFREVFKEVDEASSGNIIVFDERGMIAAKRYRLNLVNYDNDAARMTPKVIHTNLEIRRQIKSLSENSTNKIQNTISLNDAVLASKLGYLENIYIYFDDFMSLVLNEYDYDFPKFISNLIKIKNLIINELEGDLDDKIKSHFVPADPSLREEKGINIANWAGVILLENVVYQSNLPKEAKEEKSTNDHESALDLLLKWKKNVFPCSILTIGLGDFEVTIQGTEGVNSFPPVIFKEIVSIKLYKLKLTQARFDSLMKQLPNLTRLEIIDVEFENCTNFTAVESLNKLDEVSIMNVREIDYYHLIDALSSCPNLKRATILGVRDVYYLSKLKQVEVFCLESSLYNSDQVISTDSGEIRFIEAYTDSQVVKWGDFNSSYQLQSQTNRLTGEYQFLNNLISNFRDSISDYMEIKIVNSLCCLIISSNSFYIEDFSLLDGVRSIRELQIEGNDISETVLLNLISYLPGLNSVRLVDCNPEILLRYLHKFPQIKSIYIDFIDESVLRYGQIVKASRVEERKVHLSDSEGETCYFLPKNDERSADSERAEVEKELNNWLVSCKKKMRLDTEKNEIPSIEIFWNDDGITLVMKEGNFDRIDFSGCKHFDQVSVLELSCPHELSQEKFDEIFEVCPNVRVMYLIGAIDINSFESLGKSKKLSKLLIETDIQSQVDHIVFACRPSNCPQLKSIEIDCFGKVDLSMLIRRPGLKNISLSNRADAQYLFQREIIVIDPKGRNIKIEGNTFPIALNIAKTEDIQKAFEQRELNWIKFVLNLKLELKESQYDLDTSYDGFALTLNGNNLTSVDFKKLKYIDSVTELYLTNCDLAEEQIGVLLECFPNLSKIEIKGKDLNKVFSNLRNLKKLAVIVTDEDFNLLILEDECDPFPHNSDDEEKVEIFVNFQLVETFRFREQNSKIRMENASSENEPHEINSFLKKMTDLLINPQEVFRKVAYRFKAEGLISWLEKYHPELHEKIK